MEEGVILSADEFRRWIESRLVECVKDVALVDPSLNFCLADWVDIFDLYLDPYHAEKTKKNSSV